MKLMTHTISTGKPKSFDDIVDEALAKKAAAAEGTVKTASTVEPVSKTVSTKVQPKAEDKQAGKRKLPEALEQHKFKSQKQKDEEVKKEETEASVDAKVKTAEKEKDEADSSGQLDVEPLHQEGESTPKIGKDKEADGQGNVQKDAEEDEAEDSGQPKAEEKCHNDPEAGRHRDGDGDQKKSKAKGGIKEASHCSCPETCTCKGGEDKADGCDCKPKACAASATGSARFMKVANLDDKSKSWLREYWSKLYPTAYVEAMLSDK